MELFNLQMKRYVANKHCMTEDLGQAANVMNKKKLNVITVEQKKPAL